MSLALTGRLTKIVKAESKAKIYFGHFFSLGRGKTCLPDVEDEERAVCNTGFAEAHPILAHAVRPHSESRAPRTLSSERQILPVIYKRFIENLNFIIFE